MNLDHVAPTMFWPLVLLSWFLVSLVVGLALGRYFRWVDSQRPRRNRFEQADRVAERKRRLERNGFKSRIGAR